MWEAWNKAHVNRPGQVGLFCHPYFRLTYHGYETYLKNQNSWKLQEFVAKSKIPNCFNYFKTTMKPMGRIKKSWKLYKFKKNLVKFQSVSTSLLRLYEKDEKNWKLHEFGANLVKSHTTLTSLLRPLKTIESITNVENCMNLWPIYSNSILLQFLYHGHENNEKY